MFCAAMLWHEVCAFHPEMKKIAYPTIELSEAAKAAEAAAVAVPELEVQLETTQQYVPFH